MADQPTQSPEEVSQIIADYMRRVDAGEQIDREDFLAEHPELKDDLRRYLDDVALVEQLAGPVAGEPNESDRAGEADASRAVRTVTESVHDDSIPAGSSQSSGGLPEEFGRYRIEKLLGQGAMGSVYLALDTELERQVALKVPKFEDDEPEMMERFYREARSAAKIQHQHICPVFDVGEIGGIRYISMAYIEGRTLGDYIDPEKPQTDRQIALLVRKLTLALTEAHGRSVIHRDLKPANIMVDLNSEPVIMDFGLARQTDKEQQSRLTQTGTIMGTPIYMSPEQVDGDMQRIGPVSDVYSLGIIFYELLAGQPPFQGSLTAVLAQIVTKEPDPPSKFRHDLDPRLEVICLKMMAKQIPDRYQSMSEAAEALTRFLKRSQASSDPLLQAVAKGDAKLAGDAKPASPAADTPADQPTDPTDTLLKQLQQQRDKAKEFAKRHQYAAATQILEQIVRQEDARCQKYVDWATNEIQRLKALPEKYRRQIPPMMEAAHKLIAAYDYAQAAALLQDFPDPLRTDEIQQLLDKAIDLQDEVDLLIADIDDAVQHKQFEGLLPNVERLLELQPGRTRTRELYEKLTGYGPKTRFHGSRSLAKKKYQEGPWGLFSGRLALVLTLAFVGVIGLVIAGVTIYVKTGKGTLKITLHDDKVRLSLDGDAIKIENLGKPITVRATEHELVVERDGLETKTKRFTLKRGETLALEVSVVAGRLAILTAGEKPPASRGVSPTEPGRVTPNQTGSTRAGSVSGWVNLFNGKDLSGWKPMVDASKWSVQKGLLTGSIKKGTGKSGWISTDRQYSDFELELEFRAANACNSGIYLRAPHAKQTYSAHFLEVQLMDDSYYTGVREMELDHVTGALYRLAPVSQRAGIKPKTWYKVRVKAVGRRITVWVNDRKTVDANLDDYAQRTKNNPHILRSRGYIGLQQQSVVPVEFRNIRIRELDKNGTPLASADPDRAVAEWVFSAYGRLATTHGGKRDGLINTAVDLPREPFRIWRVFLSGTKVTDTGLQYLARLTELEALDLSGTPITDAGLKHLKGLTRLQSLNLAGMKKITNAGLVPLMGLTELQVLSLMDTRITDTGLKRFKGLAKLQNLNLTGTKISDAGLVYLKGLTELRSLRLRGTTVTAAGVAALKVALPKCGIKSGHDSR